MRALSWAWCAFFALAVVALPVLHAMGVAEARRMESAGYRQECRSRIVQATVAGHVVTVGREWDCAWVRP